MKVKMIFCAFIFVSLGISCSKQSQNADDGGTSSDMDSAADTDTDSDVDTDTDTDMDADSDGDMDSDGDTDSDTDMDADSDGDTDGDSDTDADTDGDNDTESEVDPVCLNGILEGDEACDDGNLINNDGCNNSCQKTDCMNGTFVAGELCLYDPTALDAPYAPHVASGDLNEDGHLDLILEGERVPLQVRLGKGNGTFRKPILLDDPSGGIFGLTVADVNGDNHLDLIAGSEIFLGIGNGRFEESYRLDPQFSPNAVWVGDINSDGLVDMVGVRHQARVYTGDGTGGFQFALALGDSDHPKDAALADVNGDGNLDIVLGGECRDWHQGGGQMICMNNLVLRVYFGDGQGGFVEWDEYVSIHADVVAVGDFDKDGDVDIAGEKAVLLNLGENDFSEPVAMPEDVVFITALDADGDGYKELVGNRGEYDELVFMRVVNEKVEPYGGISLLRTRQVINGDFNGDGWSDLFALGGVSHIVDEDEVAEFDLETLQFVPSQQGWFGTNYLHPMGDDSRRRHLVAGDVDNDKDVDLICEQDAASRRLTLLRNDGTGNFVSALLPALPESLDAWELVQTEVTDLNGDGNLDLLTVHRQSDIDQLLPWYGNGLGDFAQQPLIPLEGRLSSITFADLDEDTAIELVIRVSGSDKIIFIGYQSVDALSDSTAVLGMDFADGDNDGDLDLYVGGMGGVRVLNGDGAGGFEDPIDLFELKKKQNFYYATVLKVADVNGDGHVDIVAKQMEGGGWPAFMVALGDGAGAFTPQGLTPNFGDPVAVTVADADGDGDVELIISERKMAIPTQYKWTNAVIFDYVNGALVSLKLNIFRNRMKPIDEADLSYQSAIVADFNGDKAPDILFGASSFGNLDFVYARP